MAEIDLVLVVAKLVDEMRKAGAFPSDQDLNRLAAQISNGFKAKKDEVAILRVSSDAKMLSFIFPLRLTMVGLIPLTTTHSLAAKSIREKRGEIVNNFPTYKHPTVFEAVDLSDEEKATPIQKIMSSPMIVEGKVLGVIQISRKARPSEPVGPDFTHADLAQLATVGSILGKFLSQLPAPSTFRPKAPAKT
ncbi:MAG: GAF domain-containing protein [Acidobacteriota bacterium]|nr:GAF domain-containing protein [Acidobacteriota bacterium]